MKKLTPLLAVLMLAGCQSEQAPDGNEGATPAGMALDENGLIARDPAEVEARARQALAPVLKDPASARFWNLRGEPTGAVCGQVDAKEAGKYTGPRPFVVTPEGAALVSPTGAVAYGDPTDAFVDFHIRWCATPEELATVGTAIAAPDSNAAAAEPPAGEVPPPVDVPPLPLPTPPKAREEPPPPPPAPAPKAQPTPAADEDSFSRAVVRPKAEAKDKN